MKFARYWARGGTDAEAPFPVSVWRWSNDSVAQARQAAEAAARAIAQRLSGGDRSRPGDYGYYATDRPLREEVLRSVNDPQGKVLALLTRNAYGCEVLNTATVMFVDVDLPEGRRRDAAQAVALERLRSWVRANPGGGFRVYATFAGLRYLALHATYAPTDPASEAVLQQLGSDPLYVRLCKSQESFRARLTPKPWRCGMWRPRQRYPFESDDERAQFAQWLEQYREQAARYASCRYLETVGSATVHAEVAAVLALHDELTEASSGLELA